MDVTYSFDQEDWSKLQMGVLVEQYHNFVGRHVSGRKRALYHAEFTPAQRRLIARYYIKAYKWCMVTGYPRRYAFRKLSTIVLLQRAVHFFATQ